MKKFIALLALVALVLAAIPAYAREEQPAEEAWYELDEESRVLTVRLPANPTTGYEWNFDISDPAALELLTMEYTGDEADAQMVGVGGQWVASFYSTLEGTGEVDLTLTYQRAGEEAAGEQRLIKIAIGENNQLQVLSAEVVDLDA